MNASNRLTGIRRLMDREGIDAYVIPSSDPHQSEYPPEYWKARAWMTGFTGSSGTAVVGKDWAGVWTDSRYYLEAESAIAGTEFELFPIGKKDVLDYPEHLASTLRDGAVVGFCGDVLSVADQRKLDAQLRKANVSTKATGDLVGEIWSDRPALPVGAVYEHPTEFAGRTRSEKLDLVHDRLEALECEWTVVATLDDIAWLLNLRGEDVEYNPVFLAFAVVGRDSVTLCVDGTKVPPAIVDSLHADGVSLAEYGDIERLVDEIPAAATVSCDPGRLSFALYERIRAGHNVRDEVNPTTELKARKNDAELANLRRCMVRDGAAMAEFLCWISSAVESEEAIDEYEAGRKLREFRSRRDRFVSESFNTISAYNEHGPIVHYAAPEYGSSPLRQGGIYLVDSGGQYLDGTTDITRTIVLGSPTPDQRRDFTLVLKSHIALATVRFPRGTTGHELDSICRLPLWDRRINYGHGTGHGVGYFLNVHEGPQRISPTPNTVALDVGMLISNEPGLYRRDKYGIRIENLIAVQSDGEGDFGEFLSFETLTLCPIDRTLIDLSLLTEKERSWINEYHRTVRDALENEVDCREWLFAATEPL